MGHHRVLCARSALLRFALDMTTLVATRGRDFLTFTTRKPTALSALPQPKDGRPVRTAANLGSVIGGPSTSD